MLYVENKAKLFESHTKAELSAFSPHKYKNTLSGAFVFCGGGEIRSLQLQYTFSRFSYHNAQNIEKLFESHTEAKQFASSPSIIENHT
jgi:hypothetical protein